MADKLFERLKAPIHRFDADEVKHLFALANRDRVMDLATRLKVDIGNNLPRIYNKRKNLSDYRTNPYVLLATANIMGLSDPHAFGSFLFNSKLSMGLETSFGKLVERAFVSAYPCEYEASWRDPPEKIEEFRELENIEGRAAKAAFRNNSIWREIDKDVVIGERRYLVTIKSGPNTINDTQVQGMVDAIRTKYEEWQRQTSLSHPEVTDLDIVLGLTYGTEKSTNNKDNQILAKLRDFGFSEKYPEQLPGVLFNEDASVRVYRKIGKSFWSWIGDPSDETKQPHIFLEILLALSIALSNLLEEGASIEEGINERLRALATSLMKMQLSKDSLPSWLEQEISDDELFWFMTAMSSFYDDGV